MNRQKIMSLCGILVLLLCGLISRGQTTLTINGPNQVCIGTTETYTVNSPTTGVTYSWSTTLGTLPSGPAGVTKNILWGITTGTATITVNGYNSSSTLVETGTLLVDLYSIATPRVLSNFRVACIGSYTGNDTNSIGELLPDTLFLDDEYSCPKVCENSLVEYEAFGSGGAFSWSAIGGTVVAGSSIGSKVEVIWGPAGTGSLILEEYIGQCTVKRTICIDIIEKPTAAFAVLPNTDSVVDCDTFDLCLDARAAFKDLSTGSSNSNIIKWYWDFGDGTISSQQYPSPKQYALAGVYKVQLLVTNECGCIDTFCAHINVIEDPGPEIFCQAVACENDSVRYCTNVSAASCTDYDWIAVGGTIVTNEDSCITVIWDQLGDHESFGYISLGVTCTDKCPAYTTIKVPVIKSNPIVTGHDELCVGVQYKFSIPLWPGTEYNWGVLNKPDAVVNDARKSNDVVLKFDTPGTYDVHVTWKNHIALCGGDKTFQVTVLGIDTIDGPLQACKSSTVTVPYELKSNSSANWQLTDPTGSITTSSGTTFNAAFTMTGTYKLLATDYCADPMFIVVTELTDVVDSVNGDDTVCVGQPYIYTAYNATSGTVFVWNVVDGTIVGPNSGPSVTVIWTSTTGALSVQKQSSSFPYCLGPSTIISTISNAVPSITGPDTVCSDSYNNYSSNFSAKSATYKWRVEPQTAGNIQSGTYDPHIVFKANRVTSITNALIIVDVKICNQTLSDTIEIVIMPELQPNIYVSQDTFCNGDIIEFTTDPGANYAWTFGDWNTENTDTAQVFHTYWFDVGDTLFWPDPTAIKAVTVRVKAYGSDPDFPLQCPLSGENYKTIYIKPGPTVIDTALDPIFYLCGDTISTRLQAWDTLAGGSPSYQWYYYPLWNSTSSSAISGATSSLYTATAEGYYYCIVTGANGCRGLGNTIQIIQEECPDTACLGNISIAVLSEHCGEVVLGGTPVSSTMGSPQITSFTSINSANDDTGQITFVTVGNHRVRYLMQVEQSPGVFCPVVTNTWVNIPLIQQYQISTLCGAGQYDITFIDNSAHNVGTLETTWEFCTNLSFTGTLGVDYFTSGAFSAVTSYTLPTTLAPGQWYVRQRSRLVAPTAPVGSPPYCETILNYTVPQWPTVSFTRNPSTSLCEGLPIEFAADITPTPGTVVSNYLWDFGDGTFSGVNPTYRVYEFQGITTPLTRTPILTVTDIYGCVHTSNPQNVNIYPEGPNGVLSGGTTVCNGPVTLTFTGGTGSPVRYMWSDVGIFTTSTSHNVNVSGSYFVTIEDAYSCRRVLDAQDVTIVNPKNNGITGRTDYCQGEDIFLEGYAGDNVTYIWKRNTTSVGGNNPYVLESGVSNGSHNYTLDIISSYSSLNCTSSVGPLVVTVNAPPSPPTITAVNVVNCPTYELQLVGSAPGAGNLQWSNGPTGSTYDINSGGPYRLFYYDNNGCVSFDDTLIPEAPERYFGWFPDGCYTICQDQFPFWLYGPPGMWDMWEWAAAGGTTVTGMNSAVPPYQITAADDYTLTLDNGLCSQTTEVMSVSSRVCGACPNIIDAYWFYCDPANPGGYTFDLTLNNPFLGDIDVTVALGSGPVMPFKLNVPNGSHLFNLYAVTMQGPPDTIEISYTKPNGQKCFQRIFVDPSHYGSYPCTGWPTQKPGKNPTTVGSEKAEEVGQVQTAMVVFPNPANHTMIVNYNYGAPNDSRRRVMVYDMMGRRVTELSVTNYNASNKLDVANWAQGVYVVRMEEDGKAIHTVRVTITH